MRRSALRLAWLFLALPAQSPAESPLSYRVRATLSVSPARVEGSAVIRFTNSTERPLHDAVLLLLPNRFAQPDRAVNDFNRPYVYPEQEFDPGRIDVDVYEAANDDPQQLGEQLSSEAIRMPALCAGCAVRVRLATPLAPGAACTLLTQFTTVVPHRFGSFGEHNGQVTLLGGWHPLLADLGTEGWAVDAPPPPATFDLDLAFPASLTVLVNGEQSAAQAESMTVAGMRTRYLSLVAAPDFERRRTSADASPIELLSVPVRLESRISLEANPHDQVIATLADAVRYAPQPLPRPAPPLFAVQVPARLTLALPSEGMLLISDRAMKVHPLLRPFHERQIAQAAYAEWLRASGPRGDGRDGPWVTEGVARILAGRFQAERPRTRSVREWIDLFNVFAIVDRFEMTPKVPFVDTFFEGRPIADELHERITTFNNDLPPGGLIVDKLRNELGDAAFDKLIDDYVAGDRSLREHLAAACGARCLSFLDQWLAPYPEVNYSAAAATLNEPHEAGFRHILTVRKDSTRPIWEPVDVAIRSIGGELTRVRWNGEGNEARLVAVTNDRAWRAIIDPDRRLVETTRVDNARPRELQLVLDTAEVEVSSTEFGFAALAVARARYDYRKDMAVAAIYTNRGIGGVVGPRLHWGEPNDATSYRHNLFAFYALQALDRSFHEESRPQVRTTGHTNGLGVRYDYNDIYSYDNPTDSLHLRLFTDWYDRALGSDYNYVGAGASLGATKPLWTPRTVLAAELSSGFTQPLGSSRVPLQGQFSLGGARSIRGIGAEEEIARNIFVVRAELRRALYPELDLNFLDIGILRRTQVRLFVDSGNVSDSAGAVFDPRDYAVGIGTGFGLTYEFFGFFPATAYLEIATRVDRSDALGDIQVLFGSRQAF